MTDRDTDLMRQAPDALEQHDNPQRWPFAVKHDSRAVRAAGDPTQTGQTEEIDPRIASCRKIPFH